MAVSSFDAMNSSRLLSSSVSSLSGSRQQSSQIAKAYRQAAQLFLTRRLPEALSTIQPIITPPAQEDVNGSYNGDLSGFAPIANASRGTRVKVWSFYLTFLNAVVELGAEEGKHAFGSTTWKALVSKCRDGSVWEDVVRDGYAGAEGDVDAEVVVNLSTLLLTHSPSQRLNQQRMETYLSASANPTFDVSSHMQSPSYMQRRHSQHNNGTSTPRDLNTRLKLLELYTLHVLPRNEEWDYAREFISMSEVLDDERKEAFLLALHSLKEEKEETEIREAKLRQQQQEQMEQRRKESEARRLEQSRAEDERRKREEENRRQPIGSDEVFRKTQSRQAPSPASSRASRPAKKAVSPPPSFYHRASAMFASMQQAISSTAQSVTTNPMAFFRFVLFLLAFALAFGRRDLRERIKRTLSEMWMKIRRTVGMGVKVSYI
ncbi:hypothetical protein BU24DRAFT_402854 [Aaosphaeria arxii CBS 175.79]|uniref:Peroxin 26 n=1 Tax=Aaosphaeria arxii CBS 175.79 TaxID=1450172 RepID=A0A6A5X6R2_9PLEO|nr:uncharacterized protein BU24DRAFT_402854 [Aaosphaeria arxii CBS 175.79]KAF2008619.1 hypothetical protein BU24DRAFT_402854 [Aaosphaeria arxii CBS 175.79]